MLEANANLTWRDVQHVIASSAVRDGLQATSGWTRNGEKRKMKKGSNSFFVYVRWRIFS